MTGEQPPATGGFIQFGDGPPIPVTSCTWTMPERLTAPEGTRFELRNLSDFSAEIPLPPETAVALCRAIGRLDMADRIEIATHPDLAELNTQIDGLYDELQ